MSDSAADFGTGLRAHLGLEQAQLDLVAQSTMLPVGSPAAAAAAPDAALNEQFEALAALEAELHERERSLTLREATLAGRAGSLLAAAQALYDEVLGGGGSSPHDDELGRMRRRKSVA